MEHYKFMQNTACEYFPCHEVEDPTKFNCLFCFCPLYALKDKCGGDFTYTEKGIKSCMNCTKTHGENAHEHVMKRMKLIMELGKRDETIDK